MVDSRPDIALCWPGKTVAEYAKIGIDEYLARIRRFRSCRCLIGPEEPASSRFTTAHRLEREGAGLLKKLDSVRPYFLVVVDPRGGELLSRDFAELLQRQCYDDARAMAFVVGGPDGVFSDIRDQADLILGLSRMTLPHDMARLLLAEQIYRGFTIIHGLPYNR